MGGDANMDDRVKDFLTYDYTEAKDLAKSFLTLVSAILVGTITFSEKIINFQTATASQRRLTIASWVFFVLAIISAGTGLVFLYNSAGIAVDCEYNNCNIYYPLLGVVSTPAPAYRPTLLIGNDLLGIGGALFVVGLFCLVISAVVAARPRRDPPAG
jgi:hypothetical protein